MWKFTIDILHRLLYGDYVYGVKERYYTKYNVPKIFNSLKKYCNTHCNKKRPNIKIIKGETVPEIN